MYSESHDLYYKGIDENISRRLYEHNSGKTRYSDGKGPWRLVYLKTAVTKSEAPIEEKRLKRLNKRSLESLIISAGNEIEQGNIGFNSEG